MDKINIFGHKDLSTNSAKKTGKACRGIETHKSETDTGIFIRALYETMATVLGVPSYRLELNGPILYAAKPATLAASLRDTAKNQPRISQIRLVNVSIDLLDESVVQALEELFLSRTWNRIVVAYCCGKVSSELAEAILQTRRLELYGETLNMMPAIGRALGENSSTVKCLKFRTRFHQESIAPLAVGLETSKTLKELCFTSQFVDAESVQALARGLSRNQHLTLLSFYSCEFFDEPSTEQLINGLVDHPSLDALELRDNNCFGMAAVASLVRSTKHLQKLDLYHPPHTIHQVQVPRLNVESLAVALEKNQSLTSLTISNSGLHDGSAAWLAMALRNNATLQTLDLTGNLISRKGIQSLAVALPEMMGLRQLYLWNNRFDGVGARAILEGVRSNLVLEEISTFSKFSCSDKIQYYTHLNKSGRRILQNTNSVPLPLWSEILGRVNQQEWGTGEKASVFFHFLREGPVLF
jgi:Ran GTPase-activating protein (RanGAP) involved in mRNA processing and transport